MLLTDLFLAIALLSTILTIFFLISFFLSAHTDDNVAPWEDEPVDHDTSDYRH